MVKRADEACHRSPADRRLVRRIGAFGRPRPLPVRRVLLCRRPALHSIIGRSLLPRRDMWRPFYTTTSLSKTDGPRKAGWEPLSARHAG